jgi:hypothetical protein
VETGAVPTSFFNTGNRNLTLFPPSQDEAAGENTVLKTALEDISFENDVGAVSIVGHGEVVDRSPCRVLAHGDVGRLPTETLDGI